MIAPAMHTHGRRWQPKALPFVHTPMRCTVSRLILSSKCFCTQALAAVGALSVLALAQSACDMAQCQRCQAHSLASTSAPALGRPATCRTSRRHTRRLRHSGSARTHRANAARSEATPERRQRGDTGLGDVLGPIGLTLGGQLRQEVRSQW